MQTIKVLDNSACTKLQRVNTVVRELRTLGVHILSYDLNSEPPVVNVQANFQQRIGLRAILHNFIVRNGVSQGNFGGTLIRMESR